MALPLTSFDFPLYSIGPHIYAKTQSSPILTAMDDQMAADIALRLNSDEMRKWGAGGAYHSQHTLVYG